MANPKNGIVEIYTNDRLSQINMLAITPNVPRSSKNLFAVRRKVITAYTLYRPKYALLTSMIISLVERFYRQVDWKLRETALQ